MITSRSIIASLLLLASLLAPTLLKAEVLFNRDVRPILSDNCFHCHGPAEDSRESGLRLDVREDAIDYGAIVPSDVASSLMIERIESDDPDLVMPPPESKKSLTKEQKETLKEWIESGAKYARHWSLNPLPKEVELPQAESAWPRSEIDRFILEKIKQAKLSPNGEIDREGWLRRVTFDLTGLPPTEEEITGFTTDSAADAYERVVDRLLASPAYAERMASEWLDLARYADSYGYQRDDERYVWPYRDWVIESFQKNRPYDEFVTWQLAGDLLPNATREQKIATTFCRLHSHKKEGGVDVEEFRVENVADRAHTFSSAFLGLTMECCRCHDHKFDPITTKEYYQLTAFFANIDERGLISYFTDATPTPAMPLPSAEQETKLQRAEAAIEAAEAALPDAQRDAEPRFEEWLKQLGSATVASVASVASVATGATGASGTSRVVPGRVAHVDFDQQVTNPPEELLYDEDTGFVLVEKNRRDSVTLLAFENKLDKSLPAISHTANQVVDGIHGKAVKLTGDESVVVPKVGHIERHEPLSVSLWVRPSEVKERCVIYRRSGGWDDAGSIGYALVQREGKLRANVVHFWPGNAIAVETNKVLAPNQWCHVTVTYDGSSKANGLRIYVNGTDSHARVVQDHLTRTISGWRGGYQDLAIGSRYRDRGFKNGIVDDFRVYDRVLTPLEARHDFDGKSLNQVVDAAQSNKLSQEQRAELKAFYLAAADESVRSAKTQLQAARQQWNELMDETPAIMIMREQEKPRPAYVLERGGYDAHGEPVTAGTPGVLPEFPNDAPRNRLGLAQWLFQPDHPLTARVAVNRYWQMIFAAGLVKTPEDFGSQSTPPTHPELLDWLARDFVDHGWDVRRLVRQMVLSSTYRQSAVVESSVRAQDPENRLLSRGPSKRLSAEMIRDEALAASGLLADRVGGPPVKPYDLPLAYNPLDADSDAGLYRRSLYTFWKRTSPSPVMMTMNASRRDVCSLKREVTSTPLQALVMLNGTQFIEAARVMAEKLLSEHGDETSAMVADAFLKLTSREPDAREIEILQQAYQEQVAEFQSNPELAEELLELGIAPRSSKLAPAKHAAATVVINSIMNLDESLICR